MVPALEEKPHKLEASLHESQTKPCEIIKIHTGVHMRNYMPIMYSKVIF